MWVSRLWYIFHSVTNGGFWCYCYDGHKKSPLCLLVQLDKLRPEFRSGLDAFTKFVFERTRPKQVGATVMTGPILARITQSFLDAINNGAVPTITSSWQVITVSGALNCFLFSLLIAWFCLSLSKVVGLQNAVTLLVLYAIYTLVWSILPTLAWIFVLPCAVVALFLRYSFSCNWTWKK